MSGLSEIFTPAFFIILAIVFLLIALLVVYIENKWKEQNHKIASMLSLVSSLAEEINVLRFNFITYANGVKNDGTNSTNLTNTKIVNPLQNEERESHLIYVSDDEEDLEEDSEEDSEEDLDDDDLEDEDTIMKLTISENDEEEEKQEVIEIGTHANIKVLKVNIDSYDEEQLLEEDLEEDLLGEEDLEEEDLEEEDLAEFDLEDSVLETQEIPTTTTNHLDLKSIDLTSSLEEMNSTEETNIDYKKLSLSKLKAIVSEKELISDPSKLNKNKLLKLLGVE